MKAVLFTLGCKVNDCESASLSAGLEEMGYEVYDDLREADLYILNTCAVTKEAEAKSRQLVARAKKYNPDARIFVCGCAAERDAEAFLARGVRLVTGARRKDLILESLADCGCKISSDDSSFGDLPAPKRFKTRSYVKIQDGCNRFCSYCIIPFLRGRSRSRELSSCLAEIRACRSEEIVLTGIDLSSFRVGERHIEGLLEELQDVTARIRLGSLEVSVVTEEMLSACAALRSFAPQFHLSLQSGSDEVLRKMNRHYTRAEYLAACERIRAFFPNAAITTDIIVGFPTETEEDFQESLSIVEEAGFAQVHCFAF
ncbi:MAG: MiaB/RimO family radical SAM methylthiotransferase, partial [Christensenellaceae bacterium]